MRSFEDFYKGFGFDEYPFAVFTAESEKEKLKELFVKPSSYGPILDTFGRRSTVVICGERGTGKTALVLELERRVGSKRLLVRLDDFSGLVKNHSSNELYKFLLDALAERLFVFIASRQNLNFGLSKDDKLILSYLLKFHTSQLSKQRLVEKMKQIQVPWYRKLGTWFYNFIRTPGNVVATAAVESVSDLFCKSLGIPPQPPVTETREYFPKLSSETLNDMEEREANLVLLTKVTDVAKKVGATDGVLYLLDKVDEDPKLEGDAEEIADFMEILLKDLKLLLHSDIQFVVSSWTVPLEYLKARGVRFQKLSVEQVAWAKSNLEEVLNKRVQIFSLGKVKNYKAIFGPDVTTCDMDALFKLANKNPRDLWHLHDGMMKAQYELDANQVTIGKAATERAIEKFVRMFNFYEYYPRNAKARANSMDVYAYIAHLQKLSSPEFTKNELNSQAGTGSSTNNYVSAMKNMGLILETDQKGANGAVVYGIRDPKVVFAMSRGIEIVRG